MSNVPPALAIVHPGPMDCVAAHLVIQGYADAGHAVDRLAAGDSSGAQVRAGVLEPEDRDEVERLLALWDEAHDDEMARLEASRPEPEEPPFEPSDEDHDDWLRMREG